MKLDFQKMSVTGFTRGVFHYAPTASGNVVLYDGNGGENAMIYVPDSKARGTLRETVAAGMAAADVLPQLRVDPLRREHATPVKAKRKRGKAKK